MGVWWVGGAGFTEPRALSNEPDRSSHFISYLWPLKAGPLCEVPALSQLSFRTEECLLLLFIYLFIYFTSYLSGNDGDQWQQKENSLFQCRTPTPFELFTQAWPDFTREWEREGDREAGPWPEDKRLLSAWEQKLFFWKAWCKSGRWGREGRREHGGQF